MGYNSEDSKSSEKDRLTALAGRARELAMSLPDDVTARKTFSEPEAEFLSALRDLAASYALAHTWSESEARMQYVALKFADAAFNYASLTAPGGTPAAGPIGPGDSPSCTAKCRKEMQRCLDQCNNDPDSGFTCYFDCRISFYACEAGCIVS